MALSDEDLKRTAEFFREGNKPVGFDEGVNAAIALRELQAIRERAIDTKRLSDILEGEGQDRMVRWLMNGDGAQAQKPEQRFYSEAEVRKAFIEEAAWRGENASARSTAGDIVERVLRRLRGEGETKPADPCGHFFSECED